MRPLVTGRRLLALPLCLALAGAAFRFAFQHSIETRFQILLFTVLAGVAELASGRPRLLRLGLGIAAVALSITLVRLHLEGPPRKPVTFLNRVIARHVG